MSKPKRARAASNTERGKASRLRAIRKSGFQLTRPEHRFLQRYTRERRQFSELRSDRARIRGARRTGKRTSAAQDSRAISGALGQWLAPDFKRRQRGESIRDKTATTSAIDSTRTQWRAAEPPDKETIGDADMPKSSGRKAAARVRIGEGETARWVTAVALTDDWKKLAGELASEIENILDAYKEDTISGIDIVVGGRESRDRPSRAKKLKGNR